MGGEFRIGGWVVQPSLNLISQNGKIIHLEPKVMEVLVCLAERAGEPVVKEELIRMIWPGTFVSDDVLKRCVGELRRAFEDDARQPRVIETIPKRGYRLLVPVEKVEAGAWNDLSSSRTAQDSLALEQKASSEHPDAGRKMLQVMAGCLLLVACVSAAYWRGKKSTAPETPALKRLTFERGIIYTARFGPDNQIIYDASWDTKPVRIFTTHAGILQPMPLDFTSTHLLGVSQKAELALALNGYSLSYPIFLKGTLARAPLAGGAPRQLAEDVRWADWDSNGELAVVRHLDGRSRLEYPIGKVLYDTAGWISHIRFSPRKDRIAFIDHPYWMEDRGSVAVLDLSGQRTVLSREWGSAQGLAWSARGDEIWFSAAKAGERRDLVAVDLHGRERKLLQIPGGLTLQDISPEGRVLLTVDNERYGVRALTTSGERDLSWLDLTLPLAISPDGKQVLLDEQSKQAGSDYWVGLRNIDGGSPVRLGDGWGGTFSPDGKWTATSLDSVPESIFLLPIGAGERKELRHPGISTYSYAVWWMPDGRSVGFVGVEQGHLARFYIQQVQDSSTIPVTPEGTIAGYPSPDGKYVVALQPDQTRLIYRIADGDHHAIAQGAEKRLWPVAWSADSRYLYLHTRTGPRCEIWRLAPASGEEKLVKQLSPSDPAGILEIFNVLMTPNMKTFVYGYDQYLSELYIVDRLH